METYSHDVIAAMRQGGAMPDIVSVGNEITNGMLWPDGQVEEPDGWAKAALCSPAPGSGRRRTTAVAPDHDPHRQRRRRGLGEWYFDNLTPQKPAIDFDLIGLSYYPDGKTHAGPPEKFPGRGRPRSIASRS